jgi:NADH dehydrogenase
METIMRIEENPKLAVVFGGGGFLGSQIVRAFAKRGWRVLAALRRPDLAFHLQTLGNVGQIRAVQANLRFRDSVLRAAQGADCVVNAVGILAEGGRQRFAAVHELGARNVAEAAFAAGARLVHVSAIGADPDSASAYGRSKAAGEAAATAMHRGVSILRPSIVFGAGDHFFNRFGAMAQWSPALPVIGGATRFQPVFVGDVAEAAARLGGGEAEGGRVYELGGPEIATMRECLERLLEVAGRRRLLVHVPMFLARTIAGLTGWLPGAPLTADQLRMLETDNVVSADAQGEGRTLAGLGIRPTAMAAVLPSYLVRFRPQGQFTARGLP